MSFEQRAEDAHLEGIARLHQQLVAAWQHPSDVLLLDNTVSRMMQDARWAEALKFLDEVLFWGAS